MRFETGKPTLSWLNRILAIAYGASEARAVRFDVFEML